MNNPDSLDQHVASLPDGVDVRRVPGRPDPRRRGDVSPWRSLLHPSEYVVILLTATIVALGVILVTNWFSG